LLHPIVVHFVLAFLVAGGACEACGLLARSERARGFGSILVLAGTASLVVAVATGFLAQNVVEIPEGAHALVERHERVGLLVLALFLGSQFWKGWVGGRIPDSQRLPYAALLAFGVLLVVYGAFLGGEMVYTHGVGVLAR
jgi:uncharacterized membrane protein